MTKKLLTLSTLAILMTPAAFSADYTEGAKHENRVMQKISAENTIIIYDANSTDEISEIISPVYKEELAEGSYTFQWKNNGATRETFSIVLSYADNSSKNIYKGDATGTSSQEVTLPGDFTHGHAILTSYGTDNKLLGMDIKKFYKKDNDDIVKKSIITSPTNNEKIAEGSYTFEWRNHNAEKVFFAVVAYVNGKEKVVSQYTDVTGKSSKTVMLPTGFTRGYVTLWSYKGSAYLGGDREFFEAQ